jgi:hypothetical protein
VRYGTCNFESFEAAVDYYRPYGFAKKHVSAKLYNGEIRIGVPNVPANAHVYLDDGRYIVETVR